jgi:hypothetical protein
MNVQDKALQKEEESRLIYQQETPSYEGVPDLPMEKDKDKEKDKERSKGKKKGKKARGGKNSSSKQQKLKDKKKKELQELVQVKKIKIYNKAGSSAMKTKEGPKRKGESKRVTFQVQSGKGKKQPPQLVCKGGAKQLFSQYIIKSMKKIEQKFMDQYNIETYQSQNEKQPYIIKCNKRDQRLRTKDPPVKKFKGGSSDTDEGLFSEGNSDSEPSDEDLHEKDLRILEAEILEKMAIIDEAVKKQDE